MAIQDEVKRLIEKRESEAVKKGITAKSRMIAQVLGEPIRDKSSRQSSSADSGSEVVAYSEYNHEWNYDFNIVEEDMPIDEDLFTSVILGYHYDGLSNAVNIQIFSDIDSDWLKITYDGYEVYRERQGKLEKYIPSERWEGYIESLFRLVEPRVKMKEVERREEERKTKGRVVEQVLDYLRQNWGLNLSQ